MLYYMADRVPLTDPATALPHICRGAAVPQMWWDLSSNQKIDDGASSTVSEGSRRNVSKATEELRRQKHSSAGANDSVRSRNRTNLDVVVEGDLQWLTMQCGDY